MRAADALTYWQESLAEPAAAALELFEEPAELTLAAAARQFYKKAGPAAAKAGTLIAEKASAAEAGLPAADADLAARRAAAALPFDIFDSSSADAAEVPMRTAASAVDADVGAAGSWPAASVPADDRVSAFSWEGESAAGSEVLAAAQAVEGLGSVFDGADSFAGGLMGLSFPEIGWPADDGDVGGDLSGGGLPAVSWREALAGSRFQPAAGQLAAGQSVTGQAATVQSATGQAAAAEIGAFPKTESAADFLLSSGKAGGNAVANKKAEIISADALIEALEQRLLLEMQSETEGVYG